MVKRWYYLFIALILAVCTHAVAASEYPSFNTNKVHSQAFLTLDLAAETSHVIDPASEEEGSVLNDNLGPYFLSASRRIINDGHGTALNAAPDYFLLIAFLTPPLLELATQSSALIPPQHHWTSKNRYASSRLSGWKEANTLYTHKHTRHS